MDFYPDAAARRNILRLQSHGNQGRRRAMRWPATRLPSKRCRHAASLPITMRLYPGPTQIRIEPVGQCYARNRYARPQTCSNHLRLEFIRVPPPTPRRARQNYRSVHVST